MFVSCSPPPPRVARPSPPRVPSRSLPLPSPPCFARVLWWVLPCLRAPAKKRRGPGKTFKLNSGRGGARSAPLRRRRLCFSLGLLRRSASQSASRYRFRSATRRGIENPAGRGRVSSGRPNAVHRRKTRAALQRSGRLKNIFKKVLTFFFLRYILWCVS